MTQIFEQSEALWKGEIDIHTYNPFQPLNEMVKIAQDTWFFNGFSNMVVRETDDGLIVVDPGAFIKTPTKDGSLGMDCDHKFEAVGSVSRSSLNTAIYTHGHLDHICGAPQYVEEARSKGLPSPQIIAHEAILNNLQRYQEVRKQIGFIHHAQFQDIQTDFPVPNNDFSHPTFLYEKNLEIGIGGIRILIRHDRGETEDHSWVFFPDSRVLCTGDLFIWSIPNAGNPQLVRSYVLDWARALRKMVSLKPEILVPGHGLLIMGEDRVRIALEDTANFLESLYNQTLFFMKKGVLLDDVINAVKVSEDLVKKPYLQPVFDEVEFVIRKIWESYNGWHDGIPSRIKPAPVNAQGGEIARLAGGVDKVAARAEELLEEGSFRLACHLVDWAYYAAPEDPDVRRVAQRVYRGRAEAESSIMSVGIFSAAAKELGNGEIKDGNTLKIHENEEVQDV